MAQKKVLVLGGTGAMGVYLIPKLLERGYKVDVLALEAVKSDNPDLTYTVADAYDTEKLESILKSGKYDGMVDFIMWNSAEFDKRYMMFLDNVGHYIDLSSYRVYDNLEHPITESSPQMYDTKINTEMIEKDDYSIYKAINEDKLENSGKTNWTVVRPAITYSKRRFQLINLEGISFVPRALAGKKVAIPEDALNVQATMSWGGDVAEMIARLLFNDKAYGEAYTVSTAEHHTWGEIANYYKELIGLEVVPVPKEDYINIITVDEGAPEPRWQLDYDRLFDRIMDNSKVLHDTGLKQSDLMPLYEGLKTELGNISDFSKVEWNTGRAEIDARMDEYFKNH